MISVAQEFAAAVAGRLLWCPERGGWLVWTGRVWTPDDVAARKIVQEFVAVHVRETARLWSLLVGAWPHRDHVVGEATYRQYLKSIGSAQALEDILRLAQPHLRAKPAEFDADPWLLNTVSGVLDLKTGYIVPHHPNLKITRCAPVPYEPEAKCPRFLQFLEDILPDPEARQFLQMAVGASLVGLPGEKALLILCGPPDSGKTTLLNVLRAVLGDYAGAIDPDLFTTRSHDSVLLQVMAQIVGVRLLVAVESRSDARLRSDFVKRVTGGDPIMARHLYQPPFTFVPVFKMFLATNRVPQIDAVDTALWQRIRIIEFTKSIPPDRQDRFIGERLLAEAPGILHWALEGLRRWWEAGCFLRPTPLIRQTTERHRAEQDVVGRFLMECCALEPGATVASGDLWEAYAAWSRANGEAILSRRDFAEGLRAHGLEPTKGAKGARLWRGARLVLSFTL
jgi:putative DNA primase/helicase